MPVEAMEENLRATLACFAAARPEGRREVWDGVTVACSAVDFSMFNTACLTAPVATTAELGQRISQAARFFAAWDLPWSFWICDYWLDKSVFPEIQEAFRRHGLYLALNFPGMEAEALLAPAAPADPGLAFRRVEDAATRQAFTGLMCAVFGLPAAAAEQVYGSERFWKGDLRGWLAYRDGTAVASAATLASTVIGLYAVGTLPAHRRRGYGEAVTRHAIGRASEETGLRTTVLQASEAGFHMYRRMGYHPTARYAVFAARKG